MAPKNSLDCDEVGLLKGFTSMPSLTTMTDNWESECTMPSVSGESLQLVLMIRLITLSIIK